MPLGERLPADNAGGLSEQVSIYPAVDIWAGVFTYRHQIPATHGRQGPAKSRLCFYRQGETLDLLRHIASTNCCQCAPLSAEIGARITD